MSRRSAASLLIIDVKSDLTGPALFDPLLKRWWTYEELAETTEMLAGNLVLPRKALVFSFCQNTPASVAWYLGAAQAEHAIVLLSATLAPDLRDRLIATYKPDFPLTVQETIFGDSPQLASDYAPLAGVRKGNYGWRRKLELERKVHPDLAVLLSTSGSTGSPKLVRLSEANIQSNAQSILAVIDHLKTSFLNICRSSTPTTSSAPQAPIIRQSSLESAEV